MNSPCAAGRPENPFSRFFKGIDGPRRLNASRSSLPSDNDERRAPCRDMRGARRLVKPPSRRSAGVAALVLAVTAVRAVDAAVSILREGREAGRHEAKPEEGGERQCEGKFHDPSPCLFKGSRWKMGVSQCG